MIGLIPGIESSTIKLAWVPLHEIYPTTSFTKYGYLRSSVNLPFVPTCDNKLIIIVPKGF